MLVSLRGGIQNIQADAAILKIASQKTLAMTRKTRVPERFLRGLSSPFREGNGRLARILSILMALQAGLPGLDFGGVQGPKKKEYIAAIHSGFGSDYQPMIQIFLSVIKRTIKNFSLNGY